LRVVNSTRNLGTHQQPRTNNQEPTTNNQFFDDSFLPDLASLKNKRDRPVSSALMAP
jgi:hypothetical protein